MRSNAKCTATYCILRTRNVLLAFLQVLDTKCFPVLKLPSVPVHDKGNGQGSAGQCFHSIYTRQASPQCNQHLVSAAAASQIATCVAALIPSRHRTVTSTNSLLKQMILVGSLPNCSLCCRLTPKQTRDRNQHQFTAETDDTGRQPTKLQLVLPPFS